MSKKIKTKLIEKEIDQIVIAQADDDSAWGKPVRVRKAKSASLSIPRNSPRAPHFSPAYTEQKAWKNG